MKRKRFLRVVLILRTEPATLICELGQRMISFYKTASIQRCQRQAAKHSTQGEDVGTLLLWGPGWQGLTAQATYKLE